MRNQKIITVLNTDKINFSDKPTGLYKGNGNSTQRTIVISGVGTALLVTGSNGYVSIVTGSGAFSATSTSTTVRFIPKEQACIKDDTGTLLLKTASDYFNALGITYYYRLL